MYMDYLINFKNNSDYLKREIAKLVEKENTFLFQYFLSRSYIKTWIAQLILVYVRVYEIILNDKPLMYKIILLCVNSGVVIITHAGAGVTYLHWLESAFKSTS